MARPRVLLAITVYNGREFVPGAISSATRLVEDECSIDVLVLDDCSPEPGWSEELRAICADAGVKYYRSPRNLGIPRNVNMGLLAAVKSNYDYVIIANSDVIFPRTVVPLLLRVANEDPNIGSVTAWSNNVSVYSLPNADPDGYLANQDVVDWLTASLSGAFGSAGMDVPAGISFCILIPVPVIRRVGLMDPVFGRGYCEETDWSLRSQAVGYRITLAPSVFVYHRGQASTVEAGLLPPGHITVPTHEAIVAMRYPLFPSQVGNFLSSDLLTKAYHDAVLQIAKDAARDWGYTLELAWMGRHTMDDTTLRVVVDPRGRAPELELRFIGFSAREPIRGGDVRATLRELLGRDPSTVNVFDHGREGVRIAQQMAASDAQFSDLIGYPQRV